MATKVLISETPKLKFRLNFSTPHGRFLYRGCDITGHDIHFTANSEDEIQQITLQTMDELFLALTKNALIEIEMAGGKVGTSVRTEWNRIARWFNEVGLKTTGVLALNLDTAHFKATLSIDN